MIYLKFVKNSKEEILRAVEQDGYDLQYVSIKSTAVLTIATAYRDEYRRYCEGPEED